jgi:hypothetical protein
MFALLDCYGSPGISLNSSIAKPWNRVEQGSLTLNNFTCSRQQQLMHRITELQKRLMKHFDISVQPGAHTQADHGRT